MEIDVPIIENVTISHKKHEKGLKGRKKAMVEALGRHLGIVTSAAQELGITRELHYRWLKSDPIYKEAIEALEERKEDVIEKAFLNARSFI